jgi:hypothetical protein
VDRYLPDELFGPPHSETEASGRTVGAVAAIAATLLTGGPEAEVPRAIEGSFSIIRWVGYPAHLPKPTGPFRLLSGREYDAARGAADRADRAIRDADPAAYAGKEIHEIQPVKFGGNPIDLSNKIALTPLEHSAVTVWRYRLMRELQRGGLR